MAKMDFRFRAISAAGARNAYQKQRIWQRGEANQRRVMRPLRDRVNKVIRKVAKAEGFRRNEDGKGRILPVSSGGWESESDIFGDPAAVVVRIKNSFYGMMSSGIDSAKLDYWFAALQLALMVEFGDRVFDVDRKNRVLRVVYHPDYLVDDAGIKEAQQA